MSRSVTLAAVFVVSLACAEPNRSPPPPQDPEPTPVLVAPPADPPPPSIYQQVAGWLACHPYLVAELEFGPDQIELLDAKAGRTKLAEQLERWAALPEHEQPETLIVLGYHADDEASTLASQRAAVVHAILLELGVEPSTTLVDGSGQHDYHHEPGPRTVVVLAVDPQGCIL